jgi:aspartate ammonia-lyase
MGIVETRTEHDLLGSLEVPAGAYYGIHAVRAGANFPLGSPRLHPFLISSLALVKKAAALTNHRIGLLPAEKSRGSTSRSPRRAAAG